MLTMSVPYPFSSPPGLVCATALVRRKIDPTETGSLNVVLSRERKRTILPLNKIAVEYPIS